MTGGWKCGSPDSSTCRRYTGSAGTTCESMKSRSCFWSSSDRALNSKSIKQLLCRRRRTLPPHPDGGRRRTTGVRPIFEGLLLAVTWIFGWVLLWRVPRLPAASSPAPGRRVSVVVPARNEAGRLPRLLVALGAQTRPADEVLVVDDHSEDGTGAVADAAGVDVVAAPPLPDGWTGKTWACSYGGQRTSGDVLVFLDADTEPEPDLIGRVLEALDHRGGLLSVMPYHRMQRQYERLSAFFSVISLMGVGAASARRSAPVTGAYGPCLACDRRDYDAVGGHETIRGAVVDDVAMAQQFRRAGFPVRVVGGRGAISFRLYGGGLRDL